MRLLIFILALLPAKKNYADTISIDKVRILYGEAAVNYNSCEKLISSLSFFSEKNNPLLAGYKACATMIMAKHVLNPFSKFSIFTNGKLLLERSIRIDKANIELRFLRFSVQTKSPQFLGYNKTIEEDKRFLIQYFVNLKDLQLKQLIISFLRTSKYLSKDEKQIVNR